jgi:hypothetical protein
MAVANEIRRVAPTVYSWQAYEPAVKCDLSSAAIVTAEGLVLIDPIALAKPALATLASEFTLAAIILTNGNHARDSDAYRKEFRIPICAHAGARDSMDVVPDLTLSEGEPAPCSLRVVEVPGAGPGEIAVLGKGVACIGDAVINLPPEGLRLLPPKYCSDPAALPGSLRKLLSHEFDILTFAHGSPLAGQARRGLEVLLS